MELKVPFQIENWTYYTPKSPVKNLHYWNSSPIGYITKKIFIKKINKKHRPLQGRPVSTFSRLVFSGGKGLHIKDSP
jgi:hypothetical protein